MSLNSQVNIFNATDATRLLQLVPIFLCGTLLYLYRDKVPDSFWLAAASAILVGLSFVIPLDGRDREFGLTLTNVFAPALAYLMIWLGIHLPLYKVGSRNDYSYGIYIYGYPVTQLLAVWGVYHWGVMGYTSSVVVLTVLFAVGSWWLIEKNALRLKKIGLTRPSGQPAEVAR
jgi:peptidoglycan/LPS O-acetylase OafA/YrhL